MSRGALIATVIAVVIIVAAAAAIIAMRGGKTATPTPSPTTSPSPTAATTSPAAATTAKPAGERKWICVVYDIGGRGDLSFNDMAYLGASRAAKDFGLELKEVQSTSEADYLPNLRALAQSKKCAVIVAVGFLMTDAVKQVSKEYPDQLFAIIDGYVPNRSNVLSVLFKEHEGSAVVGALAGMVAHYYNCSAVGVVLGMEIPVLYKFEAGYYWGIRYGEKLYEQHTGKKVKPLRILYTYTGAFNDPARGKTATEAQLAQGACIVYNVAGATGLGIFEAVEEAAKRQGRDMGPPFAIGVDSDQDWIKPGFILASMMKRVDVGVYTAVKRALDYYAGKISKYGGVLELGLAEGGVGMSRLEDLQTFLKLGVEAGTIKPEQEKEIIEKVKKMREQIPKWIWDEAYKLQETLKKNKNLEVYGVKFSDIEKMIPLDAKEIQMLRDKFKVG
jgi:basic membrane protein A